MGLSLVSDDAPPVPAQAPARRVFVNRNLRFDQIRTIGFDMDYTLAPYVKEAIEELSFKLTAKRMVEHLNYPEELLSIAYEPDFVVRGLVIDKKLGNILKMDGHNHVGRGFHGRKPLDKEARRRLYRNAKIRLSAPRYHWLDTLFSLPEAALFADIITLYEDHLEVPKVAYAKLFEDIRTSIDTCHRDGSLKAIVKADLPKYIVKDPQLPATLHKLRSAKKRLFVITNSYWDYTNAVMSYLLDDTLSDYANWRAFFDLVIVGAQKPAFFQELRPFSQLDPERGVVDAEPATELTSRGVYQGGSLREFERLIPMGEEMLYVGDHIYGDVIRSKRDSLWRTALVIEELEAEATISQQSKGMQEELLVLEDHRDLLDHDLVSLKLRIQSLEQQLNGNDNPEEREQLSLKRRGLREEQDRSRGELNHIIARRDHLTEQLELSFNRYWGSVFKEGRDLSRFGDQVEKYACIYTSRVSNLLAYSPHQYFRAPRHWMPHEKV